MTSEGAFCLAPLFPDELCDQCNASSQCTSGFCTTVVGVNAQRPFCTRPCDPTPGQPAQCPQGYSCMPVLGGQVGGACAPNAGICEPRGKGGQNERCMANGSCKPGLSCVNYYPQAPQLDLFFCYSNCPTQAIGQSCTVGGGTACLGVADRQNTAACFSVARESQPCIPEVCDATTFCAYDPGAGPDSALCYRVCPGGDAQCPAQHSCQTFEGIPPLCVPLAGFRYDGQACASDAECLSRTCRVFRTQRLCTSPCSVTDPESCSDGFKCIPGPTSSDGLCWPESFSDPDASEPPPRSVEFCACDVTSRCDPDCDCDPECEEGCGCSSAGDLGADLRVPSLAFAVVALSVIVTRRRRKR
jgi:hypothetical protein